MQTTRFVVFQLANFFVFFSGKYLIFAGFRRMCQVTGLDIRYLLQDQKFGIQKKTLTKKKRKKIYFQIRFFF